MPTQRTESLIYQSYLLRLWRDKPDGSWRVSLQSTATEELRHFATVDAFWAFLQTGLGGVHDDADTPPTGERANDGNSQQNDKIQQ